MTRINLVHPSKLCDQHLLAELRELPRIPNGVLKGRRKPFYDDAPRRFKLGKGHEKFFVNRMWWLHARYNALMFEAVWRRGFSVKYRFPAAQIMRAGLFTFHAIQYRPTKAEIAISAARIRRQMPPKPRYKSENISRKEALRLVEF